MHEDLPPSSVHQAHDAVHVVDGVVRNALGVAVRVGLEQPRGVGLDDAVGEHLDRTRLEPGSVGMLAEDQVVLAGPLLAESRRRREGRVDAHPELVAMLELDEQVELLGLDAGVLDAGHPQPLGLADGAPQGIEPVFSRRHGQDLLHEILRVLLQRSGSFPGARVAHDDAVLGVGRAVLDAGQGERPRVDPGGVAVVAGHHRGSVLHCRVELGPRRKPAGEGAVEPATAEHPGPIRVRPRKGPNPGLHVREIGRLEEVHAVEGLAAFEEMNVRVVEAGDDGPEPSVDDLGPSGLEGLDLQGGADPQDLAAGDRDGLRPWARRCPDRPHR
jgi:hypothetical protein